MRIRLTLTGLTDVTINRFNHTNDGFEEQLAENPFILTPNNKYQIAYRDAGALKAGVLIITDNRNTIRIRPNTRSPWWRRYTLHFINMPATFPMYIDVDVHILDIPRCIALFIHQHLYHQTYIALNHPNRLFKVTTVDNPSIQAYYTGAESVLIEKSLYTIDEIISISMKDLTTLTYPQLQLLKQAVDHRCDLLSTIPVTSDVSLLL